MENRWAILRERIRSCEYREAKKQVIDKIWDKLAPEIAKSVGETYQLIFELAKYSIENGGKIEFFDVMANHTLCTINTREDFITKLNEYPTSKLIFYDNKNQTVEVSLMPKDL